MESLGCDVSANKAFDNKELYGTLFEPSRNAHIYWCMAQKHITAPTAEGLKRWRALKECKEEAAHREAKEKHCPEGFRVLDLTQQGGTMQCIPTEAWLEQQQKDGGTGGTPEHVMTCTIEQAVDVCPTAGDCNETTRIEVLEAPGTVTVSQRQGPWHQVTVTKGLGWVYSGEGFVSLHCPE
jgi:hypothetical protein